MNQHEKIRIDGFLVSPEKLNLQARKIVRYLNIFVQKFNTKM